MATDVLVVGNYTREHALAWKLKQSKGIRRLYIAPGNPGTAKVGENVPIDMMDFEKLADFAEEKDIGLTVVGMDDPLGGGIVDVFRARGLRIFGPTKAAAQIESSKAFAKTLMHEAGIPTAEFQIFDDYNKARAYVNAKGTPIVVKASGLALGKGVYVCKKPEEAEQALKEIMLDRVFKDAGNEVVIEEYLDGQEISIHVLSDGKTHVLFPPSQDHKPVYEDDEGPNTGGMGAIVPVPWVTGAMMTDIDNWVVTPALEALAAQGATFSGLLYPGLKMTSTGPKVLEFNARFGAPECEVYMRLLKSDLLELLQACVDGTLAQKKIEWNPGFAVNIMLASGGYPISYKKGFPITGIEEAEKIRDVVVFHAGTKIENLPAQAGGQLVTAGGRVLSVSAVGDTLNRALEHAYEAIGKIHFEGMHYRRDIGAKVLAQ